jgi:hypothetical protein
LRDRLRVVEPWRDDPGADIIEAVYEKVGGFSKEPLKSSRPCSIVVKETLERGEKIKIRVR